jgi:hypothetical protein
LTARRALALLVGAGSLVWVVAALRVPAPSIFVDELLHAELARNLLDGDWLRVRGERLPISVVYPVVTAPGWLAGSTGGGYALAKAIGAVSMCLTAVPVWLLARRLCGDRWALLAAGLTLLLPTLALSGALMLETVALPLFALAALAISRALERPTAGAQLLALGSIVLAALARFQGALLLPLLGTAVVLFSLLERRSARPWLPALAGLGALAGLWIGLRTAAGDALVPTLGVYEGHASAAYDLGDVLRFAAANAGALALATGIAPALARGLLALHRRRDAALSAYLAVTVASVAWLVGLAAFAAAWEPEGLKERYAVYAEPLLLVALPVWLARGAARRRLGGAAAALVVVALVATLPLEPILDSPSFLGNAYGLLLLDELGGASTALALATLAAAALASAVLLAPVRILRVALPATVAGLLAACSVAAAGRIHDRGRDADATTRTANREWVDDAVGTGAAVLYLNTTAYQPESARGTAYDRWLPYWETELRNESLRGTVALGEREPAPIAQRAGTIDWPTGTVDVRPQPGYVLTDRRFRIRGTELATDGRFLLTRVEPPLRLATVEEGVGPAGEAGGGASLDVYDPAVGAVEVTVAAPARRDVELVAAHLTTAGNTPQLGTMTALVRGTATAGAPVRLRIAILEAPARVDVRLSPGPATVVFRAVGR